MFQCQLTHHSMQFMAAVFTSAWPGLPCRTYLWHDNELARPSTASPSGHHSVKKDMLEETPSYLSDAVPVNQQQTADNDTIPAVFEQRMHYSRELFNGASIKSGHISQETDRAEEAPYAVCTGP